MLSSPTQPTRVLLPVGVFVGVILALALTSVAEDTELDAGPRAIPYNGIVQFGGQTFQGEVDLRFLLTDAPGDEGAGCRFEEEHGDVPTWSGRFSVNIGAVAGDLPDCVFDSEAIYIEMAVREATSEGDYAALSGSQRIHPAPFTYWAAEGSDLKVDGNLKVNGAIEDPIDDTVTIAGGLSVSGDIIDPADGVVTLDGDLLMFTGGAHVYDATVNASPSSDGLVTLGDTDGANLTMDHRRIIARDNGSSSTLTLQADGGRVEARGDLVFIGSLSGAPGAALNVTPVISTPTLEDSNNSTLTVAGGLDVGQRLFIEDLDINDSGSDGCTRIGEMQICWEHFSTTSGFGDDVTFRWSKPFLNTDYAVTANVIARPGAGGATVAAAVHDKAAETVVVSCYTPLDNVQAGPCGSGTNSVPLSISLVAVGVAGSGW